jgi:hypothetical protein
MELVSAMTLVTVSLSTTMFPFSRQKLKREQTKLIPVMMTRSISRDPVVTQTKEKGSADVTPSAREKIIPESESKLHDDAMREV